MRHSFARTRHRVPGAFAIACCALLPVLPSCGSSDARSPSASRDAGLEAGDLATLTLEELRNPKMCEACHPLQYREWSSSMHAYAADDPVFVAMNKRGQRETDRKLGDFCVRCHAPMAVLEEKTADGLNLAELPQELKGVTCYFCHNAEGIAEDHNGALTLANDRIMRGSFRNPPAVAPKVHGVAYSPLHDRNSTQSSALCGACHDVVTPKGVHMERTSKEYANSLDAHPGGSFQTCQGCHMDARPAGKAARVSAEPLPDRVTYEHLWPGVDIALGDFPYREAQRVAVECELAGSARVVGLSPSPAGQFKLELETQAGHAQPSGAAHDRRMWVEFIAYDDSDTVVYESGVIADDQGEESELATSDPRVDPVPWSFRDRLYDAAGKEVHFFWEAEKSEAHPEGYQSALLPPPTSAAAPHTVTRTFSVPSGLPARVTVRVRVRPIGRDVLEALVASNDLDAKYLAEIPTFTLDGTVVEWKGADGYKTVSVPKPTSLACPDDYRCLLDASGDGCATPVETPTK